MSTSQQTRSTSGVRGLKALFEKPSDDQHDNLSSPSPNLRGRSPLATHRSDSASGERPSSKIRASFVSVEQPGRQLLTPSKPPPQPQQQAMSGAEMESEGQMQANHRRASSTRRGSFSFNQDNDAPAVAELKKTISNEENRRARESSVAETIPEAAVEATPLPQMAPPAREDIAEGIMTPKPSDMSREIDPMAVGAASRLKEMSLAEGQPSPRQPETPKAETPNDKMVLPKETAVDTRDKFATADEEEPGAMKPAEPSDENAVSGGEALPPVAEDLRHGQNTTEEVTFGEPMQKVNGEETTVPGPAQQQQTPTPSKPANITPTNPKSTTKPTPSPLKSSSESKPTPKRSSHSLKSPSATSQPPKSPLSTRSQTENKDPPQPLPKKASRSSLTAPTAASSARATSQDKTKSKTPSSSAPRPTTQPQTLSSRLTAPTAASKARHDPEATNGSAKASINGTAKPPTRTSKPPSTSSKPPPSSARSTTATRSESRQSQPSTRRPAAPPGESFLERMMRPTAASASKTHEKNEGGGEKSGKVEVKSPPRQKAGVSVGGKKGVFDGRSRAGVGGQRAGGRAAAGGKEGAGSRLGAGKSAGGGGNGGLKTSLEEEVGAVAKNGGGRVEETEGINAGNEEAVREVEAAEKREIEGVGAGAGKEQDGKANGPGVNSVGEVA